MERREAARQAAEASTDSFGAGGLDLGGIAPGGVARSKLGEGAVVSLRDLPRSQPVGDVVRAMKEVR